MAEKLHRNQLEKWKLLGNYMDDVLNAYAAQEKMSRRRTTQHPTSESEESSAEKYEKPKPTSKKLLTALATYTRTCSQCCRYIRMERKGQLTPDEIENAKRHLRGYHQIGLIKTVSTETTKQTKISDKSESQNEEAGNKTPVNKSPQPTTKDFMLPGRLPEDMPSIHDQQEKYVALTAENPQTQCSLPAEIENAQAATSSDNFILPRKTTSIKKLLTQREFKPTTTRNRYNPVASTTEEMETEHESSSAEDTETEIRNKTQKSIPKKKNRKITPPPIILDGTANNFEDFTVFKNNLNTHIKNKYTIRNAKKKHNFADRRNGRLQQLLKVSTAK